MITNQARLVGNVGKNPEIRVTQAGAKVATFSLATSEIWKDKVTGERKEKTFWHRVVVWNPWLVEFIQENVKQGSLLQVIGQITNRMYEDKDGIERQATEIEVKGVLGEIQLIQRYTKKEEAGPVNDAEDYGDLDSIPF